MIKPFRVTFVKMTDGSVRRPPGASHKRKKNWYSDTQEVRPRPMAYCPRWLRRIFITPKILLARGILALEVKPGETWLVEFDELCMGGSSIWVRPVRKIEERTDEK